MQVCLCLIAAVMAFNAVVSVIILSRCYYLSQLIEEWFRRQYEMKDHAGAGPQPPNSERVSPKTRTMWD